MTPRPATEYFAVAMLILDGMHELPGMTFDQILQMCGRVAAGRRV